MIRGVELIDFEFEIPGIAEASRPAAEQADGDIAGFQAGSRDWVRGIGADAGAMLLQGLR